MRSKTIIRAGALLAIFVVPWQGMAQERGANASETSSGNSAIAKALETEAYLTPPNLIADFINAPRHKNHTLSNLSPDGTRFLISETAGMTSVDRMGRPYHNLGGIQIDPAANRSRALTNGTGSGFTLLEWKTEKRTSVEVPKEGAVSSPSWSPDGSKIAYLVNRDSATYLAVADVATGKSRVFDRNPLLATQVTRPEWSADGKSLFAVYVPEKRGPEPKRNGIATQPLVRIAESGSNRTRTYRNLLENANDQVVLEYFLTGQLAKVDAGSGRLTNIGESRMYRSIDPAPSGMHVRVTTMLKPFSYLVPASSFGSLEEVVDLSGKPLIEVSRRPLRTGATPDPDPTGFDPDTARAAGYDWPEELMAEFQRDLEEFQGRGGGQGRFGGGQGGAGGGNGRRSLGWAPDGNGMVFLQLEPAPRRSGGGAEEGQAPAAPRTRKDRLMRWLPPFGNDDQKVIYEVEGSIGSAQWGSDGKTLFLTETVGNTTKTYAAQLDDLTKRVEIQSRTAPATAAPAAGGPGGRGPGGGGQGGGAGAQANLNNPGTWVTKSNSLGVSTMFVTGKGEVLLSGTQYYDDPEKEAPRPFLDAISITDGKKRRVWQSSADLYETISAYVDADLDQLMISRQSPTSPPNSYLVPTSGGSGKAMTDNQDFAPAVTNAVRHRIQITRADGFKFWAEVTLPEGHVKGNKLPALFWFYPREYADQAAYDRQFRTRNKNTFQNTSVSSKDLLVMYGYAVVEPDCPIVGPEGRMNDSYVKDLKQNLYATINKLTQEGYIDRDKLAIGGHSYGAFSAANAMVHTPFFKAGIAGDGAYNRLMTPMAFQSEQRLLWEARETYLTMSPLLYAENMSGAFLMYHGADDQNVGTHPMNSERMFHALLGLGKPASMYMYPYEDHGPAAKETHMDLWSRWVAWLDKYVKGVDTNGAKDTKATGDSGG